MEKELEKWHELHKFYLYSGKYQTEELAKFLGVTPRTIQRWLKEKTKPNLKQIRQINEYLMQKQDPQNNRI